MRRILWVSQRLNELCNVLGQTHGTCRLTWHTSSSISKRVKPPYLTSGASASRHDVVFGIVAVVVNA